MTLGAGFEVYKIALPWLLKQAGLGKWLRDRALHQPSDKVDACVADANGELRKTDPTAPPITIATWRAVEATQAKLLGDGIQARVTPKL